MNQRGNSLLISIVIGLLVMVAIGGAYYLGTQNKTPQTLSTEQTPNPQITPQPSADFLKDETASWNKYENKEYKLDFRYPQSWTAKYVMDNNNAMVVQLRNSSQQQIFTLSESAPAIGCGPVDESLIKKRTFTIADQEITVENFCGTESMYITTAVNADDKTIWMIMTFPNAEDESTARLVLKSLHGLDFLKDSQNK